MPAIVEFPHVVAEVVERFADLFPNKPQRQHFAEYLTGLIVAKNKSVSGINSEFVDTTDQSCLNRFVTAAEWDVEQLNARRLELMQEDSATRYSPRGVIAIDDVLIDHDGKLIEDVGWFWDHAEQRYKIAHDYLFANYVCESGKHYPLEFRRFKKRDQCEATGEAFQDHGVLLRQLIDRVCEQDIPGDFTFDSYFSSAENLNHIHDLWAYFDPATAPGSDWQQPWFNDTAWPLDPTKMGYGDEGEVTQLTPGSAAKYFRKSVNIADPASYAVFEAGIVRDDGAVVYVNGTEVWRNQMPAGEVTFETLAALPASGSNERDFQTFTITSDLFVPGDNLIAVEIHQNNVASGDMGFDFKLEP